MIENLVRQDEWNAMKDWAVPQSKLPANKELHNCVSNVVYRQTNKMGRFDLGCFDFGTFWLGTFWLGTFWLGTFWLWDILTWDVLTLGRFDLGRFDSGTFWLGTFWLWDVLTWDILTLGQEMFAISSLIKYSENILGTFWLTKNGTFWQITWDVLVLGRFDRIPSDLVSLNAFQNGGKPSLWYNFCLGIMISQLLFGIWQPVIIVSIWLKNPGIYLSFFNTVSYLKYLTLNENDDLSKVISWVT